MSPSHPQQSCFANTRESVQCNAFGVAEEPVEDGPPLVVGTAETPPKPDFLNSFNASKTEGRVLIPPLEEAAPLPELFEEDRVECAVGAVLDEAAPETGGGTGSPFSKRSHSITFFMSLAMNIRWAQKVAQPGMPSTRTGPNSRAQHST